MAGCFLLWWFFFCCWVFFFYFFLTFSKEEEREVKINKLLIKEVLCFIHSNLMWQGSVTGCVKLRLSG